MNKNPFSIYDFLGYLFPGLIFGNRHFLMIQNSLHQYHFPWQK